MIRQAALAESRPMRTVSLADSAEKEEAVSVFPSSLPWRAVRAAWLLTAWVGF